MPEKALCRFLRASFDGRLLATCAVASLLALPAQAQPAASSADQSASTAAETVGLNSIETITVTATRREEKLQDVPLTITALTPEEINRAHITGFSDIFTRVPGISFQSEKGDSWSSPVIRGLSANNQAVGLGAPVAFYEDDLYYGTPASYSTDFYDVAQIAVLKGPQGTTFGRNTIGGAVQVTTKRPEMGVNDAQILGTLSNYSGASAWGYVNYAVSDDLAARLSLSTNNHGGYTTNVFNNTRLDDNHQIGARAQLRWEPASDFSANLLASWMTQDNAGTGRQYLGNAATILEMQAHTGGDPRKVYYAGEGYSRRNLGTLVLHMDLRTDWGTLQSITGVHTMRSDFAENPQGLTAMVLNPGNNLNKETAVSQEIRLVSPNNQPITYVAGIYGDYANEYMFFDMTYDFPASFLSTEAYDHVGGRLVNAGYYPAGTLRFPATVAQKELIKSIAPYFEGTWHVTDALGLTAGVRYTIEQKSGYVDHEGPNFAYGFAPYFAENDKTWYALTPRAIVNYKLRPDLMFYASVSKGTQSGGFSFSAPTAQAATEGLAPEKSWSYEAGMKGTFFDGLVHLNLAAYNAVTSDLQTKTLVEGLFKETNAGNIKVRGVEVEGDWQILRTLNAGLRYAYTYAYYGSFPGCTAGGADCTGHLVPYVPMHDLLGYASYDWELPDDRGVLTFNGEIRYSSDFNFDVTGPSQFYARPLTPIHGLIDASVLYTPTQGNWTVQLWAKNLTDKLYVTYSTNYYFYVDSKAEVANAAYKDQDRVAYGAPRTFGVTVNYKL